MISVVGVVLLLGSSTTGIDIDFSVENNSSIFNTDDVISRIVGGSTASKGQFPYQVSVQYFGRHLCGGSILDKSTILCAAHCVVGRVPSLLEIVVGFNDLTKKGDVYDVKRFVYHENYRPRYTHNDISLIKLDSSISYGDKVQPVKLPSSNIDGGEDVILSGWGRLSHPGRTPKKLQWIKLRTIDLEECKDEHHRPIIKSQLCTFTRRDEGACYGDSGGPLVDTDGHQVGIVSWGRPCARGKPDVFTRVYYYLDWIEDNRD